MRRCGGQIKVVVQHRPKRPQKEGIEGGIRLGEICFGRSERIRTSDPLLPKQVRYQTALRSDRGTPINPFDPPWQEGSR